MVMYALRVSSLFVLAAMMTALGQTNPTPPVAPREDHREMRHGATVVDDYFWLREKSNPKVVRCV